MNRRFFLFDALICWTLGRLALPTKVKKKLHTDFEYATVLEGGQNRLSPNAHSRPKGMSPFRDCILPYLNGKPQELVQTANAVEGWMDILENKSCAVKRVYGDVQLLWSTPERKAEFAKLYPQWR